ncbi:sigma-70 family RNA polymerase sigma factor [Viridibacillus arvi]|uniref:sigma-70 family RNA polymerase sigma factor n=1 Tax=Viridibacillus arvi TaxID=263475 RepID=UPI0037FD3A97
MVEAIETAELKDMEYTFSQMIKDYSWMRKEIDRLQNNIHGYLVPMNSWGVAQYGIDAAMPKGSSGKSKEEMDRMDARERRCFKRLTRYETEVYLIETAVDLLDNEVDKVIYDCLLDGMSFREIALHLGISKDGVQKAKKNIVAQIVQDEQVETFLLYGEIDNKDK